MSELRSEVAQAMSLDQIRYSQVWEDHRLLEEGLAVEADDDVLSITSAGDNVLALLLSEPRSVIAIDMNPAQSALLELKLAAIAELSHEDFATLVGVRAGGDRLELFRALQGKLSTSARSFWEQHHAEISTGVVHTGRLEAYIFGFARDHLPDLWAPDLLDRLIEAPDLASQKALFEAEGRTEAFCERFRWYFGREMMEQNGRDPAQFVHVRDGDVGAYFLDRFTWACTHTRLRDNFYVEFFLSGRYRNLARGPAYLRPANYQRLRDLVGRVRIVTGELERLPAGSYSKANLSDVFEYMTPQLANGVFTLLADRLRPGGRLAWWNLLVPREVPTELRDRLVPLEPLATELWGRDRSWFYRAFFVAEACR